MLSVDQPDQTLPNNPHPCQTKNSLQEKKGEKWPIGTLGTALWRQSPEKLCFQKNHTVPCVSTFILVLLSLLDSQPLLVLFSCLLPVGLVWACRSDCRRFLDRGLISANTVGPGCRDEGRRVLGDSGRAGGLFTEVMGRAPVHRCRQPHPSHAIRAYTAPTNEDIFAVKIFPPKSAGSFCLDGPGRRKRKGESSLYTLFYGRIL